MNRIATLALTCATLAAIAGTASATTTPAKTTTSAAVTPGIGAALWGASSRVIVTPGATKTIWVAFYSTGPQETATVSTQVASPAAPNAAFAKTAASYYHLSATSITLPAKPAAPVTLTHIPNGAGGYENLTTSNAYVFVTVTITVPAGAPAYSYTTGDAYENITGQVQVAPAAGITTSPGAGLGIALSTH